ncbi:serine/threonine protein kinase [Tolypothrix sp. NIES-4075]|uniref:serine/threonine protein kinase n=1 Tax=Tolypothrix sp. NIES-4075 TaxID=2005459 RepID=UPI000B5C3300|nr:serine/threonine protein kinase [Tolypothrix sp. NIES-4075]GAX42236.1 serine/threonine protein kinase [Tolypothrix sp. NIES-4075]
MIGKLLDHRYQVVRVLATGGFGETYIAQDTRRPGNPICVVKHLKGANSDPKVFETAKRLFQSEAETLEKLGNHDQIPRLLAYFDENKEFYLVQEFIEGHTLSEELVPNQRWSESEVIQMLLEVLNILEFVHREGVIHRDIKPDNIIRRTCDHKLVLVDFGAVKQLRSPNLTFAGQTTATVAVGTPGYMPTEQGQGKPRPNSDIYSLGIIAIQALTGVAPIDFQEDPDTGEIIWQHLAPVSPELAAVLSKMVRYHFKDRYNSVMQALLSLQLLSSVPAHQEYAKTPSYEAIKPSSQMSRQQTIAVAPANHAAKPARKESNRPDLLPLVIAALLAGGTAAVATNLVGSAKNLGFNFASNGATSANICEAVVTGNSNIRSEPSAINSENIVQTVNDNTPFEVTGKRTKLGWVEVKLDSGKSAWANSHVIANPEQWVSCLRDKGIAIKTVNDSDLIAARPIPQPIPKPAAVTSSPKPEKLESPKPEKSDPFRAEPFTDDTDKLTAKENNSQVVEQAREKYDNGDLAGAIALLKSLPANASSTWKDTAGTVSQWQQDWAKAEALSNEINKALDNGQWDKVLAYKDHPEKLPNIQYWRDKMEPLFKQAADNLAKQELPKIGNPHHLNHRQHQVETFRQNVSPEESDNNIDSETITETDENGF